MPEPVRGREEYEEVIPLLAAEELECECEARLLQGAEIGHVFVEAGAEGRRVAPVGGERLPVALPPVEGEDAASLVDRQPAVHDHRALRSVLVERKIDEHRPLALTRQELVVGGPAKVACAGGAHSPPSRSIMKS